MTPHYYPVRSHPQDLLLVEIKDLEVDIVEF